MRQRGLLTGMFAAAVLALVTAAPHAAPPAANKPATTVFGDNDSDRVRSDGGGAYVEAIDCVRSWFSPSGGNFYFRTASNTFCDYLNGVPQGETQRSVHLDFSSPVAGAPLPCTVTDAGGRPLNLCGDNLVVDVRMIADDLFKSAATDTPLTIHFDLYPNFVNDTAFMLQFVNRVPISGSLSARTLNATNSIAELSVRTVRGKKSSLVPVAQFNMSFTATVTPCPTAGC